MDILGYDTNVAGTAYDLAVIGAGVFGAWTAYQFSRAGARVLLLDQHGPGNARSSSGGETRIIRMSYGADEIYTRSSTQSLKRWKEFFAETGLSLFHQTGVLVTSTPDDPYLIATRDTLSRICCRFEWLERDSLRERFPHIMFEPATTGVYEPESGVLMARRAVQAVVDAAVRAGTRYENWRADAPTSSHTLRTTGGNIEADAFVFACGPWLPALFPKILGNRIRPTRQQVFFFGAPPGDDRFAPPQTPAWIAFHEGAYAVPSLDGRGFKLAVDRHGPPFDPETGNREITRAKLAEARFILDKRFPGLAGAPLLEARVCQYENTSNGDFLVDRHPDFENVWLAGGGSGHGFKHGPFVGEYIAARIVARTDPEPRFSLTAKKIRRRRTVY